MSTTRTVASMLFASLFMGIIFIAPTKTSSQIRREKPKASEQSLTGEKAVDELKRSGDYESLKDAFQKATGGGTETENLFPGGSYEEVAINRSSATLSAGDRFGYVIDISGDSAVISAYGDDMGSTTGFSRGSAFVFTRSGSTWTQQAKLVASDGVDQDYFGSGVAISGDTVVIGAMGDDVSGIDQGSVYVFTRSGTIWTQQAKLLASDGGADDYFGYSVAVSGGTIVVGANLDDGGGAVNRGSVYIFTGSGATWTQQQKITVSDYGTEDRFGEAVSISGDTVVVGVPFQDIGLNTDRGAAYVFTRSGTSWTQQQKLTVAGGATSDYFGGSVDVENDMLVVGRIGDNLGSGYGQGSAHVFTRSGTTWTQQQKLVASDGAPGDLFGSSVSMSGNRLAVGAHFDDIGSNLNQGSAYVFTFSGTTWTQQQKFTASDGTASDSFGWYVAISGDTVAVGAPYDQIGGNIQQGSVKIFQTKMTSSKVIASDGAEGDLFGASVAISGNTAVVGASLDDGTFSDQGSAYVFTRSGTTWTQQQKLTASDGAASDWFGYSVAISGDTVVVGALYDDVTFFNQGSAYVFTRSGSTWTQQQKLTASDGASNDIFGLGVAVAGDTVVVGASQVDISGRGDQGSAYVFTRSGSTWTLQQKLTASDGDTADYFGHSVAISGDTVVVGAVYDGVGTNTDQGSAYVFTRSGSSWTEQQQLIASDGAAFDFFGWSVAISGDTVVVGAIYDDVTFSDQGSAYIFTRSGSTWTLQQKLTASDGAASELFGYSVAIFGNTVGVGAAYDSVGSGTEEGSAYLFVRSGTTWTMQRKLVAIDGAVGDRFGVSVAVSDVAAVVGSYADDIDSRGNQGSAHMYYWGTTPTAGGASLSGRVLETNGRGLANATVVLTDSTGVERTVQTGSFGRFSFSDLPSGETYIVSVRAKRFVFAPQVVNLQSDLSDVRLEASGRSGR